MSDINQTTNDEFASALDAIEQAAKLERLTQESAAKIAQGRIDLVLGRDAKAVFFASVAMRLEMLADPTLDTAATNGRQIKYNPQFIAALSREELVGVLAHEVLHITNAHHARMGERDSATWNEACDLAINPLLRDAGMRLPAGGLFPGEGKYVNLPKGLSAEEYYSHLPKPPPGTRPDPGQCGGVQRPGKGSPAECRKAEAEAKELTAAAHQAVESSGRGNLPGGLARAIEELLEPRADWRSILREFVARSARNDYSWSRPNRRFVHAGVYLPGLYSEEVGHIVLAIDVSGSIGAELLREFAAETQGILEAYDCQLTVLYHDSVIQKVQEWKSTDGPLVLQSPGGGGTSHVPVFEHIEREALDPACLVCLTDLYTAFPPDEPAYPTLWCNVQNNQQTAPFGRVLRIR